jgi:hypothetical protein
MILVMMGIFFLKLIETGAKLVQIYVDLSMDLFCQKSYLFAETRCSSSLLVLQIQRKVPSSMGGPAGSLSMVALLGVGVPQACPAARVVELWHGRAASRCAVLERKPQDWRGSRPGKQHVSLDICALYVP